MRDKKNLFAFACLRYKKKKENGAWLKEKDVANFNGLLNCSNLTISSKR